MRIPIRFRLFLFSLLLILIGANLTAGIAVYFQISGINTMHRHFVEELAEITGKNLVEPMRAENLPAVIDLLRPLADEDDLSVHWVLDTQGKLLTAGEGDTVSAAEIEALMPAITLLQQETEHFYSWTHHDRIAITRQIEAGGDLLGYIHLELSNDDIKEEIGYIFLRLLPVELLLILFSWIAAQLLSQHFHRPLREAVDMAHVIAAGNYTPTPISPRRDEFGDLSLALQQMALQIHENIHELESTRQELEEIFRAMVDGIVVVDTDHRIQRANARFEQLCGALERELFGRSLTAFFSADVTIDETLYQLDGKELLLLTEEGEEVPVQVSGSLLYIPNLKQSIGAVLLVHDLRDRIRAQHQEQYANFQAGVADMAASVLHNIGNVVTGMSGHLLKAQSTIASLHQVIPGLERYAEESARISADNPTFEALEERLNHSVRLLQATAKGLKVGVDRLQEISTLEQGIHHIGDIITIQQSASRPIISSTRFNLETLTTETLRLIEDRLVKYAIEWQVEIDPTLPSVQLPHNPLMQLLLNLLKNGLEAIIEEMVVNDDLEGKILLKMEPLEGERFTIEVNDNGCGIPADLQQKVFAPRFTTKRRGSGYGLHSAASFVEQIGGTIRVESEGAHHGSRMILELPLVATT